MSESSTHRVRMTVRGAVQGVGFRPFVFRLASDLGLAGWVANTPQGVLVEIEGAKNALEQFLLRIEADKPPRASIHGLEASWLDPVGYSGFEIRKSDSEGAKSALVLPDIALCDDCQRELFDPADRRHRYPFINCTNCGPRYSIIQALPYDRPNTTMRGFAMCGACRGEYENPRDRRFHAQPNACPECGPQLEFWSSAGAALSARDEALQAAGDAIRRGAVVAVKGLGGFHLMADARNDEAVRRLRERKRREEKPFALMVPSLESARALCRVSAIEERLLASPESPIVLLRRRKEGQGEGNDTPPFPIALEGRKESGDSPPSPFAPEGRASSVAEPESAAVAESVAPGHPCLGLMLPYTPLHALLLADLGFPVVATSGNLSDEPICTDEREAVGRLGEIADAFLVHNRPIARHVDDSVARVVMDRELLLRRARGYSPLPIGNVDYSKECILAVGGHLKNTVAVLVDGQVFGSQHIGDLETERAFEAFEGVIASLESVYEVRPGRIACDLHPDYMSTRYARGRGLPVEAVQHHAAHVFSCMAENELEGPVCGFSWDGTGYGLDGTVWGGEVFRTGQRGSYHRVAHLRPFLLPGGERAIQEPRRSAVGLLFEMHGARAFEWRDLAPLRGLPDREVEVLRTVLERRINAPLTSSAGRLFDGVASLVGLRQRVGYEGQAAMELEYAGDGWGFDETYPFGVSTQPDDRPDVVDWEPLVEAVLEDTRIGLPVGRIAARFHSTLAEMIVEVARRTGVEKVVLSGGCFQNARLTERAVTRLREEGFRPYWHQRVPPNDGGLALGQIACAARKGTRFGSCV